MLLHLRPTRKIVAPLSTFVILLSSPVANISIGIRIISYSRNTVVAQSSFCDKFGNVHINNEHRVVGRSTCGRRAKNEATTYMHTLTTFSWLSPIRQQVDIINYCVIRHDIALDKQNTTRRKSGRGFSGCARDVFTLAAIEAPYVDVVTRTSSQQR